MSQPLSDLTNPTCCNPHSQASVETLTRAFIQPLRAKPSTQANAQKIQGQCWNCRKAGHHSKDCWARPQKQQSQGHSNSLGKGKRCERQVKQRWRKDKQVQRCWSTCSESANWKSSWHDWQVECTPLDLCATSTARGFKFSLKRLFSVDTGAGGFV